MTPSDGPAACPNANEIPSAFSDVPGSVMSASVSTRICAGMMPLKSSRDGSCIQSCASIS
jgi:hypothetical protein